MGTHYRAAHGDSLDRFNKILAQVIAFIVITFCLVAGVSAVFKNLLAPENLARARLDRAGYQLDTQSVFRAVELNDQRSLERFQIAGISLNEPNADGITPLFYCVEKNRLKTLRGLIELGVPTYQRNPQNRLPETISIAKSQHEMTRYLYENGANPNVDIESGEPALVWSIRQGDMETFNLLLDKGADVTRESNLGSPLFVSLLYGNRTVMDQLIERGADPNSMSPGGVRMAVAAMEMDREEFARKLLKAGAKPNLRGENSSPSALEIAFQKRDNEIFDLCVEQGGDISILGLNKMTMLEEAARSQDLDWMNKLLAYGADPNQRTAETNEPLWWERLNAAQPIFTETLLGAGADINSLDSEGVSPIDRAIGASNLKQVRYLFSQGAETSGHLWNPLQERNHAMIRFLLANGEDVEVNNPASNGISPLGFAAMSGDVTGASLLLEYGAKYDPAEKPGGHSMLEWAVAHKKPILAETFVDMGADPNERIISPTSDFRELLKEHGSLSYYLRNDRGLTPLMVAAGSRQHEMARMLMDSGASKSINSRSYKAWPVNFAIRAEDIPMAQMLFGRTPEFDRNWSRKVVIDLSSQRINFYVNGKSVFSSVCSTGKRGYRTPTGTFIISDKTRLRHSTLYGSPMPYFQRLSGSAIGMHQGNCPGYPASHGCIRMPWSSSKSLYYKTKVGDIVVVQQ